MTTGKAVFFSIISTIVKLGLVVLIWALESFSAVHWALKLLITVVLVLDIIKDFSLAGSITNYNKTHEGIYEWKDRKRTFLGLPLSFTRYRLTKEKLIVSVGFFSTKEEETKLYRIMDLSVSRSFGQKLLGLGTLIIHSSDKTDPTFTLKNIKHSYEVKEQISKLVELERDRKRVTGREVMDSHHDDDCDAGLDHDDYDDEN